MKIYKRLIRPTYGVLIRAIPHFVTLTTSDGVKQQKCYHAYVYDKGHTFSDQEVDVWYSEDQEDLLRAVYEPLCAKDGIALSFEEKYVEIPDWEGE